MWCEIRGNPKIFLREYACAKLPQQCLLWCACTMRLYLDGNIVRFGKSAESKGFKLTHYVDGLSEAIFDRIKDWQNVLLDRLKADGESLAHIGLDLIEDVHSTTEYKWDGYHCFIGIRNSQAH